MNYDVETPISINSLAKDSKVDNHKIEKLLKGSTMPSLVDCMRFIVAFELHPIVAHQLLASAGYDLNTSSEQHQFYNFLITYFYGEDLRSWQLKIAETNHLEWQI